LLHWARAATLIDVYASQLFIYQLALYWAFIFSGSFMRSRYLLPLILFSTLCLSLSTAHAASLTEQRKLYEQAKQALSKNNPSVFLNNRAALRDYPLFPYLAYDELTQRL